MYLISGSKERMGACRNEIGQHHGHQEGGR